MKLQMIKVDLMNDYILILRYIIVGILLLAMIFEGVDTKIIIALITGLLFPTTNLLNKANDIISD